MKLKEYLKKYNIHPVEFAIRCKVSSSAIYTYLNGSARPHKKTAEKISKFTNKEVTVKDLRGKNDEDSD